MHAYMPVCLSVMGFLKLGHGHGWLVGWLFLLGIYQQRTRRRMDMQMQMRRDTVPQFKFGCVVLSTYASRSWFSYPLLLLLFSE